jgi:hypothetical protein
MFICVMRKTCIFFRHLSTPVNLLKTKYLHNKFTKYCCTGMAVGYEYFGAERMTSFGRMSSVRTAGLHPPLFYVPLWGCGNIFYKKAQRAGIYQHRVQPCVPSKHVFAKPRRGDTAINNLALEKYRHPKTNQKHTQNHHLASICSKKCYLWQ